MGLYRLVKVEMELCLLRLEDISQLPVLPVVLGWEGGRKRKGMIDMNIWKPFREQRRQQKG